MLQLVVACALCSGEWPQFRGANSDGHVVGPTTPMEWSDTKNVAWKVPVAGLGWSSPSIADGKVFLTTAVPQGEGLSLRVMALDPATGKSIWDREVRAVEKAPGIHTKNSHASPTPLIRGDSVYVHFGTLGTARLALSDGAIRWLCTELIYPPVHGSGGSPALYDDKLVVICDGSSEPFVAAIDAQTGKIAWRTPRSVKAGMSHSFGTPIVTVVDGQPQVLAPGPDHFAAYHLATGEELWKVLAVGWSVVPQPTIANGLVIYNHDYDNPELMAVKLGGGKGDVTDSNVVWRVKRGAPSTPTPVLVGDDLYFVSDKGIATCVDSRSGDVHWAERLGGNFSASPIYVNGHILFLNETGLAMWVKPGHEFTAAGENQLPGRTLATPAFADGAMYLRTDEFLYKFQE